jgi:mono/diheme cytochrome c family protein
VTLVRLGIAYLIGALALGGTATAARAYEPRVNFQLQCMGCHRSDGSGEEGRVPSMRRTLVHFSMLPEGREYILRVPGVAQSPLSDLETAALLNWLAHNLSDVPPPADFLDFTAAEVGRFRRQPLAAVQATRARLLETIGR